METSSIISQSPRSVSFSAYSSHEIAVRVLNEFPDDHIFSSWKDNNDAVFTSNQTEEDDFEFTFVCLEAGISTVSADEIFSNGIIKPLYPTLLVNSPQPRLPLAKLFKQEKKLETADSCSSSEAGELVRVPSESYYTGTPPAAAVLSGRYKKCYSTGSSRRWKFRDLLYRSHSDRRKENFPPVPPKRNDKNNEQNNGGKGNKENNDIKKGNDSVVAENCKKEGKNKEGGKRRSFLPYRQEMMGIFSNSFGRRNVHPF